MVGGFRVGNVRSCQLLGQLWVGDVVVVVVVVVGAHFGFRE